MNTVVAFLAVIVAIFGVFLIIQQARSKSYKGDSATLVNKNGLPITPRDQRNKLLMQPSTTQALPQSEDDDALSRLANIATQSTSKPTQIDTNEEGVATHHLPKSFLQDSPLVGDYLEREDDFDKDNSPILNAKDTVTIYIIPKNQATGISGKEILRLAETYGLKFGVMNMFHRYEHEDGVGKLWFSMVSVMRDGLQEFDINEVPNQRFNGLSLFLSLPNPNAVQGFRSMMSVANMIANDLNANILDEENYVIDENYINNLLSIVENYPQESSA